MTFKNKNGVVRQRLLQILFVIYLLAVTWIILFKMAFSFDQLPCIRNINLLPFQGSAIVNGKASLSEIIDNVIIFIPCGIYVSCLFSNLPIYKKVGIIISLSVLYETLQYIFGIGASDITDVITNSLGGIIGLIVSFFLFKIFKKENTALNFITFCAAFFTAAAILFIVLLILAN